MKTRKLAVANEKELIFGKAPAAVKSARGMVFGGGTVYPEVNLTVPSGTVIDRSTLPALSRDYSNAVRGILSRGLDLHSEGIVIEFETLLEMTLDPYIGVELTKAMVDVSEEYYQKYGLKSEIRLTPNDTRDFDRPPKMRSSGYLDNMFELFERGAEAGGDLLSIESTGGKEICDDALIMCDIKQVVFSLAVLGVRDMHFLWKRIVDIAAKTGKIAGGDTACGFANTAMVLAEKKYIPAVFAAAVRLASVVRSLAAVQEGATGPDKDCGYEGVYLKAIAGIPISMEGKTAACAHLSPVGNVAAACADLWSNESVQNIKLLAGMAPTVYAEQLIYDARLMNRASMESSEAALKLRDLLCESDVHYDPQALILTPANVISISEEIIKGETPLEQTKLGILKGLEIIAGSLDSGELTCDEKENFWLNKIREDVSEIPLDESVFTEQMLPILDKEKFVPAEYGL